ncbi:MAG: flagellar basal body rod C-terminal domain-containing protein [Balneolaceae bacterium]
MLPDRVFSTFQTAGKGLAVQREKMATASRNIANSGVSAPKGSSQIYRPQTVQTQAANPEKFKNLLLNSMSSLNETNSKHFSQPSAAGSSGSGTPGIGPDFEVVEQEKFRFEYDPNHPDADENGMVRYPDVDLVREMTQLVSANRLYEANLSAVEAEKQIIKRSLDI